VAIPIICNILKMFSRFHLFFEEFEYQLVCPFSGLPCRSLVIWTWIVQIYLNWPNKFSESHLLIWHPQNILNGQWSKIKIPTTNLTTTIFTYTLPSLYSLMDCLIVNFWSFTDFWRSCSFKAMQARPLG